MGWRPADLRDASLAELLASWGGYARRHGLLDAGPEPMTRGRLRELMERFPDV